MNRRDLFKMVFAAGVAAAVPAVFGEELPTIYGDGVHDDTEGFQAAFDGKPFKSLDGSVTVENGRLRTKHRHYLITKWIDISRGKHTLINHR